MIYSTDIKENLLLLLKMDKMALLLMSMLLATGMLFIRGAGMDYGSTPSRTWLIQGVWIVLGFCMYFACALVDYKALGKHSWTIYLAGLVLLALVYVAGARDINHRSMLRLFGINIQVSEPMKAASLFFTAWLLSHPLLKFSPLPPFLVWAIVTIIPFGMVIMHGDFGTALVFLPFSFAILFINGLKWRWVFICITAIILMTPPAFASIGSFRKLRLLVFMRPQCKNLIDTMKPMLSPETHQKLHAELDNFIEELAKQTSAVHNAESASDQEETKENSKHKKIKLDTWNADQAINSVGSGRVLGKGYMKGRLHTLGFLPRTVAPTDFIFSVIGEESGFLGTISLITIFSLLIFMTFRTAYLSNDAFGTSIALGAAIIYATHAFINIGMCIGLAPIIGIPLPFVSYGGSSIIAMMIIAGLVQSVHIRISPQTEESHESDSEQD